MRLSSNFKCFQLTIVIGELIYQISPPPKKKSVQFCEMPVVVLEVEN